jgi:hypothetical protein
MSEPLDRAGVLRVVYEEMAITPPKGKSTSNLRIVDTMIGRVFIRTQHDADFHAISYLLIKGIASVRFSCSGSRLPCFSLQVWPVTHKPITIDLINFIAPQLQIRAQRNHLHLPTWANDNAHEIQKVDGRYRDCRSFAWTFARSYNSLEQMLEVGVDLMGLPIQPKE